MTILKLDYILLLLIEIICGLFVWYDLNYTIFWIYVFITVMSDLFYIHQYNYMMDRIKRYKFRK